MLPALAAWSVTLMPLLARVIALGLLYLGWLRAELAMGLPRPLRAPRLVITLLVVGLHMAFWGQVAEL